MIVLCTILYLLGAVLAYRLSRAEAPPLSALLLSRRGR